MVRSDDRVACSERLWPRPNRLFWAIWAWATKLSIELKPAPIWKVPVGFSLTSTITSMVSSDSPRVVRISTVSKKPRRVMSFSERSRPADE